MVKDMITNKKAVKKITALFLSTAIVCSNIVHVSAQAGKINSSTEPLSKSYIIEELGDYLSGFGFDNDDEIYLSQGFDIANSENDTTLYFVKDDNRDLGTISVTEYEGQKFTSFRYNCEGKTSYTEQLGEDIALVSYGDGLALYKDENNIIGISGNDIGKTIKSNKLKMSKKEIKKKKVSFKNVTNEIEIDSDHVVKTVTEQRALPPLQAGGIDYDSWNTKEDVTIGNYKWTTDRIINEKNKILYYLNKVDFVKNGIMDNNGICWAAAGACMINWYKGTAWTAKNIYDTLKSKYGGIPVGNNEWEQKMWKQYGVSLTYVEHKLHFDLILQKLGSRKPIYCGFYQKRGKDILAGHAVVLNGCYYNISSQKYYYIYMDCNYAADKTYIVNKVPKGVLSVQTGTTFYYTDGYTLYNNWAEAYY